MSKWPGEDSFEAQLSSLSRASGSKLNAIGKLAVQNIKFYKHVVHSFLKFLKRTHSTKQQLLAMYVVDAILRHAKSKGNKNPFTERFETHLPAAFSKAIDTIDEDDKPRIARLFSLWEDKEWFSPEFLAAMREALGDVESDGLVPPAAEKESDDEETSQITGFGTASDNRTKPPLLAHFPPVADPVTVPRSTTPPGSPPPSPPPPYEREHGSTRTPQVLSLAFPTPARDVAPARDLDVGSSRSLSPQRASVRGPAIDYGVDFDYSDDEDDDTAGRIRRQDERLEEQRRRRLADVAAVKTEPQEAPPKPTSAQPIGQPRPVEQSQPSRGETSDYSARPMKREARPISPVGQPDWHPPAHPQEGRSRIEGPREVNHWEERGRGMPPPQGFNVPPRELNNIPTSNSGFPGTGEDMFQMMNAERRARMDTERVDRDKMERMVRDPMETGRIPRGQAERGGRMARDYEGHVPEPRNGRFDDGGQARFQMERGRSERGYDGREEGQGPPFKRSRMDGPPRPLSPHHPQMGRPQKGTPNDFNRESTNPSSDSVHPTIKKYRNFEGDIPGFVVCSDQKFVPPGQTRVLSTVLFVAGTDGSEGDKRILEDWFGPFDMFMVTMTQQIAFITMRTRKGCLAAKETLDGKSFGSKGYPLRVLWAKGRGLLKDNFRKDTGESLVPTEDVEVLGLMSEFDPTVGPFTGIPSSVVQGKTHTMQKHKPCFRFAEGSCLRGDKCFFSHEGELGGFQKRPCFKFQQTGTCTFGETCNFSHDPEAKPAVDIGGGGGARGGGRGGPGRRMGGPLPRMGGVEGGGGPPPPPPFPSDSPRPPFQSPGPPPGAVVGNFNTGAPPDREGGKGRGEEFRREGRFGGREGPPGGQEWMGNQVMPPGQERVGNRDFPPSQERRMGNRISPGRTDWGAGNNGPGGKVDRGERPDRGFGRDSSNRGADRRTDRNVGERRSGQGGFGRDDRGERGHVEEGARKGRWPDSPSGHSSHRSASPRFPQSPSGSGRDRESRRSSRSQERGGDGRWR
eukprot:gb/GEZN01000831.1/.p1 GENE.gb/GEZN01000831.1/~~gb/GEZN01000831.1/.p1  ORF type:complete len:1022 (+),score=80.14 gb/GEZN01000831.1/:70-3135(+)